MVIRVTECKSSQSGESARLIFSWLAALSENLLACCHKVWRVDTSDIHPSNTTKSFVASKGKKVFFPHSHVSFASYNVKLYIKLPAELTENADLKMKPCI
jgi:hypothetical protein